MTDETTPTPPPVIEKPKPKSCFDMTPHEYKKTLAAFINPPVQSKKLDKTDRGSALNDSPKEFNERKRKLYQGY